MTGKHISLFPVVTIKDGIKIQSFLSTKQRLEVEGGEAAWFAKKVHLQNMRCKDPWSLTIELTPISRHDDSKLEGSHSALHSIPSTTFHSYSSRTHPSPITMIVVTFAWAKATE